MQWHEVLGRDELVEALKISRRSFPALLPIHYYLRSLIDQRFPPVDSQVFAAPWPDTPKYWIIVRRHHFVRWYIHLGVVPSDEGDISDEFTSLIHSLRPHITDALNRSFVLLSGSSLHADLFTQALQLEQFVTTSDPTNFYYMDEETQEQVSTLQVALPEGYHFLDGSPLQFAEVITNTWMYASEGDLEQTSAKLTHLPSVVVMCEGQPVAFEMSDPSGYQNHLYTMPEHRCKGLGNAVELRLSQKCISEGVWPYKMVSFVKKNVIASSDRSPYWKLYENSDGQPELFVFRKFR